ncbi:YaaC family protein [Fictibacillus iocasae]|uniref:YaaC family protein n=1 Tax=Fictibacillus iocasae TaxID=2715437 RepID=A0ABW2NM12_9BACL
MIDHSWDSYLPFLSSSGTQSYLSRSYKKHQYDQPDSLSFENCYAFIYYIEHGKKYYALSSNAPAELRPVLLFYGMTQLIKACLLTVDPSYPDSSTVLAHGVTTRKRKKRNYEFLYDEVRIQKSGLFNHFCEKMFHVKHLEGDKITMKNLLSLIPEISLFFKTMGMPETMLQLPAHDRKLAVPYVATDLLHLTDSRLLEFLASASGWQLSLVEKNEQHMIISLPDQCNPIGSYPFSCSLNGDIYMPIERDLYSLPRLNEIMIHYLILYNLSMICRYDTEWWSDLFHTYNSKELPIILHFLDITAKKIPKLLADYLNTR